MHSDFQCNVNKELLQDREDSIQGLLVYGAAAGHGAEKLALAPTGAVHVHKPEWLGVSRAWGQLQNS